MGAEVRWRARFTLSLVLPSILLPVACLAQQPRGVKVGPVRLFPSLEFNQEYTSNFFFMRSPHLSNWVFTQSPGLSAILPIRRHSIQASYRGDIISHGRFERFNRFDHNLGALFNFEFPRGLGFRASQVYQATAIPPDFPEDRDLFFKNNFISAEASYRRGDVVRARLGYSLQDIDFERKVDRVGDHNIDAINLEFAYKIISNLMGTLDFVWRDVDFADRIPGVNSDNRRLILLFGVALDPALRFTGSFKIGIAGINFDLDRPRDNDLITLGLSASLIYRLIRFDDFRLEAAREIIQTVPVSAIFIFGPFFVSTGFTLSWDHRFREIEGLASNIFFRFTRDDYRGGVGPLKGREDDFIITGFGLSYIINRWLRAEFAYNYRQRNSNLDINDFQENRTLLKFTLSP